MCPHHHFQTWLTFQCPPTTPQTCDPPTTLPLHVLRPGSNSCHTSRLASIASPPLPSHSLLPRTTKSRPLKLGVSLQRIHPLSTRTSAGMSAGELKVFLINFIKPNHKHTVHGWERMPMQKWESIFFFSTSSLKHAASSAWKNVTQMLQ